MSLSPEPMVNSPLAASSSPASTPASSSPPSPLISAVTPPDPPPPGPWSTECRLCGQGSTENIAIFSKEGYDRGLPEKTRLCLPVLITEHDELPKSMCLTCCEKLETVRAFFETCFNANQELIIHLRKKRGSPLDLNSHINQYVRTFTAPSVPQIKIEPSHYLDVRLNDGDYDELDDGDVDEGDDSFGNDDDGDGEDSEAEVKPNEESLRDSLANRDNGSEKENDAFGLNPKFKVPSVPRKRKRGRPRKHPYDPFFDSYMNLHELGDDSDSKKGSGRGRKRLVPLSLKMCAECGETFEDHATNLDHWKEKHPDQEVVYQCTEQDLSTGESCSFRSSQVEEVQKHRIKHKNGKESVIECKLCGKFYTKAYLINRHLMVHSDRKDFKCPICEKEFKTSQDLRSHVRQHEDDDLKYTHCCELCGKRFTQRANLEAHLRVHSGFKPFSCDFCGKAFSQKGNMDEHRRVHTGERPFVCELCGASFIRRSEMALHTRIVHTGERPYQCSFCTKSFQRRDLMRKHERIHTDTRPYACQYCPKTFTQRDKMVVHTRLHTGERPYVCDVCGKGFCESGNLKKHMRVHGKEPPAVMHQNNKGKPAPVQNPAYSGKYNHHGRSESSLNPASSFLQGSNDDDTNSNPGQSRPQSARSPRLVNPPSQMTGANGLGASGMGLQLKLEHQGPSPSSQYPLSSMAAAVAANLAHNQMSNQHHALMSHQHTQQQSQHHASRSATATPVHDVDVQSDAGSERSVTSPFVPQPPYHQQPFPYHVHHSLIQHLNDWYGGHLPSSGGGGNH